MIYDDHARLIDKSNVVSRVCFGVDGTPTQRFFAVKDAIVASCLQELVERAAYKLLQAGPAGEYMVSFDVFVHAQKIKEDEATIKNKNICN